MLTPPRRISLPTTSFFGITAQGIHYRLVALRRTKDSSRRRPLFPQLKMATISGIHSPLRGNYLITSLLSILVEQEFHLSYKKSFGNIVKEQLALLSREYIHIYVATPDTRTSVDPGGVEPPASSLQMKRSTR